MERGHLENEVQFIQEKQQQEIWQSITEICNGNKEAYNDLYHCTESFIYYCVVKNGVPEDAIQDVMQEVYIGMFRNLETLRDVHAVLGWIKSIAFHKSMDYFRHNKNEIFIRDEEPFIGNSELMDTMELPENIADNKESQRLIRNLIDALPEDYKQILVAYYFDECKVNEIAEALDIPAGTVKTKLFRARKQLQESIEKLEKTQGIRLYSIAAGPVLLLLFHQEAQAVSVPAEVSRALGADLKNILKQLPEAARMAAAGSFSPPSAGVSGNAASLVSKLAGTAVKKYIIGIAALVLTGTSIVFVVKSNHTPPSAFSEESTDITEDTGGELRTEEQPTIDPERQTLIRRYYHDMYGKMCETHQWPDETDMDVSGDFMANTRYTVFDFDGDGYEEFVVSVTDADYMKSYLEKMYKYNPDTGECTEILSICPWAEYYDNGTAYGPMDNSYRFGKNLFQYDPERDRYVNQAYIFRWSRSEWEEYSGHPFPEHKDMDGDGMVWCFIDSDDNYSYMDQADYETWYEELMGAERKIEVPWLLFSEEWQYP